MRSGSWLTDPSAGQGFTHFDPVDSGRQNAPGIARPFTRRIQAPRVHALKIVAAPDAQLDAPLQFQISALDYSSYVGRIGVGRIEAADPQAMAEALTPDTVLLVLPITVRLLVGPATPPG